MIIRQLLRCVLMVATVMAIGESHAEDGGDYKQVFDKRILPIFRSANPSSCTQCHLANLDLKNYILPTAEKTFLSLRDQGLVNLEQPEASKILTYINMREKDPAANLIHETTRKKEAAAFAEWIRICCKDPALRSAAKLGDMELARPNRSVEIIRHARKDRLLESFERNIWPIRLRCWSCHAAGSKDNEKHVAQYGDRVTWFSETPAETMTKLIRQNKLLDVAHPEDSLLLQKPLNRIAHGGGKKFLIGDQGYKAFRRWIEDYANVINEKCQTNSQLPVRKQEPKSYATDIWLKFKDTPTAWGDKLLQADVYAWDEAKRDWQPSPIATSDREVAGKAKLWQHTLLLLANPGSPLARKWDAEKRPHLAAGKYLVKVSIDDSGRLNRDWQATMLPRDVVGQAVIDTRWPSGYGSMTIVPAEKIVRSK